MGTFLLVIFLVLLVSVMLLISLFKGITSFIFGKSYSSPNFGTGSRETKNSGDSSFQTHKKVFSKEEGEYVKYEEIQE